MKWRTISYAALIAVASFRPTQAAEDTDARLRLLSTADRQFVLDQNTYAVNYCNSNPILGGVYDCSCFASKVVDERIKAAGEKVQSAGATRPLPFPNLVARLSYSECASPSKITAYGDKRTRETLKMDTQVSASQLDAISTCVSASLNSSFKTRPVPDFIDGYFTSALVNCRQTVTSGKAQ